MTLTADAAAAAADYQIMSSRLDPIYLQPPKLSRPGGEIRLIRQPKRNYLSAGVPWFEFPPPSPGTMLEAILPGIFFEFVPRIPLPTLMSGVGGVGARRGLKLSLLPGGWIFEHVLSGDS